MAFNVVATLQLQGPSNLGPVVSSIQSAFRNIQANVVVNVSPASSSSIANLNAQVRALQQSLNTMGSTASTASSAVASSSTTFNTATASITRLNTATQQGISDLKANVNALNEGANAADSFGRAAGLAARRYAAFLVAGGAIIQIVQGFKNAAGAALEFEREMVKLTQVGAGTQQEIKGIAIEVTRLATSLGVSSRELIQSSVTLAQAGLNAKQTAVALEALALAALSPNFGSMTQTVEGAIAVMQQFRIESKDLEAALGSMNAVAAGFAVESKDLIEAVKRAGGAFRSTGGDLNEFLALFTSVRATTRESAEAIATGLRTVFTRLQRQDTVEALQALGVQLRHTRQEALALGSANLEGQFVGPYEAVKRLNEALKEVPGGDPRYSQIVEQLGGYRQISRVLPLIQELTTAQKALTVAQFGSFSLQTSASQAQESTIVKLEKLKQQFLSLFRTVSESEGFRTFLDISLKLASALADVGKFLTPLIPLLGTLLLLKGGQGIASFAGDLSSGLFGSASRPPIHRATGGYVPGVGDTDTIPAMLTPGEYVIRKSAVQAIGVQNLEEMNQYAQGGPVRRKRYAAGGVIKREQLDEIRDAVFRGDKQVDELIGRYTGINGQGVSGAAELREFKKQIQQEKEFRGLPRGLGPKSGAERSLVLPFQGDRIGMITVGNAAEAGVKLISGRTGLSQSNLAAQEAAKKAGVTDVKSGITVHVLSRGASRQFRDEYSSKIDGAVNGLFPADTNVRVNLDSTPEGKQAKNTIAGYIFEAFIGGIAGVKPAGGTGTFDFPGNFTGSKRYQKIANHIYPSVSPGELLDAKRVENIRVAGHDIVKKYINYTTDNGKLFQQLGVSPIRKAAGGFISGEGSVPALLTPGEYVFGAESAQRIGLNTLNQLNNTPQKFATGGTVARINPPQGKVGLFYFEAGGLQGNRDLVVKRSLLKTEAQNVINTAGLSTTSKAALTDSIRADIKTQPNKFPTSADRQVELVRRIDNAYKIHGNKAAEYIAVNADIKRAVVPKQAHAEFEDRLVQGIADIARLFGSTQVRTQGRSIISNSISNQARGRVFESALKVAAQDYSKRSNRANFDFPPTINKQGNALDNLFSSPGIFADAKFADNTDARVSLVGKSVREFGLREFDLTKQQITELSRESLRGLTASKNTVRINRNKGGLVQRFADGGSVLDLDTKKQLIEILTQKKYKLAPKPFEKTKRVNDNYKYFTPGQADSTAIDNINVEPKGTQVNASPVVLDAASLQQALILRKKRKFAEGGSVEPFKLDNASVGKIFQEFQQKTGVNYTKLVKKLSVNDFGVPDEHIEAARQIQEKRGQKDFPPASFNRETGQLVLNRRKLTNANSLKYYLAHELGHALDLGLGRGKYLSLAGRGVVSGIAADEVARRKEALKGANLTEANAEYLFRPQEGFAEAHRRQLLGTLDDKRFNTVFKVASKRFNTGGKIPSLLTPGEYVMGASAVSKFGTGLFDRVNAKRFAIGGPVTPGRGTYNEQGVFSLGLDRDDVKKLFSQVRSAAATLGVALDKTTPIILEFAQTAKGMTVKFRGFEQRGLLQSANKSGPQSYAAGEINQLGQVTGADTKPLKNIIQQAAQGLGVTLERSTAVLVEMTNNAGKLSLKFKGFAGTVDKSQRTEEQQAIITANRIARRLPDRPKTTPEELAQAALAVEENKRASDYLARDRSIPLGTGERVRTLIPEPKGQVDIESLVKQRFDTDIEKYKVGGKVSQQTTDEVKNRAIAKVQSEIVELERKNLVAGNRRFSNLYGLIGAEERHKIATERAALAVAQNGTVIVNDTGAIIRHTTAEDKLTAVTLQGAAAGGAGVPPTGLGVDPTTGIGQPPRQSFLSRIGTAGLVAGTIGATYGAQAIESNFGKASEAQTGAAQDRARTGAGYAGGLQGAALGATVGTIGGPFGIAVGAVAGGLIGYTTSIKDAEKEIRQVKINNALNSVKDKLEQFANGINTSQTIIAGIITDLNESESQITSKSQEEASSIFRGFNEQEFAAVQKKNQRETIGNIAPQMAQVLNKSAEELATKVAQTGGSGDVNALLAQFREGNSGLNRELISRLAGLEKVSPTEIENRFKKVLTGSFRGEQLKNEEKRTTAENEKLYNAFGRLTNAVDAAAQSVNGLQRVVSLVEAAFENRVGGVNFQGVLTPTPGTSDIGSYTNTINKIASPLGGSGDILARTAIDLDKVTRELPNALTVALRGAPLEGSGYGIQVRDILSKQLTGGGTYEDVKGPLKNILDTIALRITQTEPDEIRKTGGVDVTKLSTKLLEEFNPVSERIAALAKSLEDNGNRFVEGLVKYANMTERAAQEQEKVYDLQLEKAKQTAVFEAQSQGRPADAFRLLTIEDQQRPQRLRQERLVRGTIAEGAGFDPAALASALAKNRTEQLRVEPLARAEAGAPGAATKAFTELQAQSQRLASALGNLARVSERNALLQERLSKIGEDRQSRLGFGERFLTSDAGGRAQINRGLGLVTTAANQGNVRNFNDDQRKLLFETLNSLGGSRLTGVKGSPIASDLKTQLIEELGVFGLDPGTKKEEKGIQDAIKANIDAGIAAQQALADDQKSLTKTFFDITAKQQEVFLAKLAVELQADRVARLQIEAGKTAVDTKGLEDKIVTSRTLSGAGVSNTDIFKTGGAARKELEAFAEAIKNSQASRIDAKGISENIGGKTFASNAINATIDTTLTSLGRKVALGDVKYTDSRRLFTGGVSEGGGGQATLNVRKALGENLKASGIQDDDINSIIAEFAKKADDFANRKSTISKREIPVRELYEDFDKIFQNIVETRLHGKNVALDTDVGIKGAALKGKANIGDPGLAAIQAQITGGNGPKFIGALDKLGAGDTLPKLEAEFIKTTTAASGVAKTFADAKLELEKARADLTTLENKPLPPGGIKLPGAAFGGSIYSPKKDSVVPNSGAPTGFPAQGSDTVLAMLTPGEFVVRKEQAEANRGLLEKINKGRGPLTAATGGLVYLAGGGPVPNQDLQRQILAIQKDVALRNKGAQLLIRRQPPVGVPGVKNKEAMQIPLAPDKDFVNYLNNLPEGGLEYAYRVGVPMLANYYKQVKSAGASGYDVRNAARAIGAVNDFASLSVAADSKEKKVALLQKLPASLANNLKSNINKQAEIASGIEEMAPNILKATYLSKYYPFINRKLVNLEPELNKLENLAKIESGKPAPNNLEALQRKHKVLDEYLEGFRGAPTPETIRKMNLAKGEADRKKVLGAMNWAIIGQAPAVDVEGLGKNLFQGNAPVQDAAIIKANAKLDAKDKKQKDLGIAAEDKLKAAKNAAQLKAQDAADIAAVNAAADFTTAQTDLRVFDTQIRNKLGIQPGEKLEGIGLSEADNKELQTLQAILNNQQKKADALMAKGKAIAGNPEGYEQLILNRASVTASNKNLVRIQNEVTKLKASPLQDGETLEARAQKLIQQKDLLEKAENTRRSGGLDTSIAKDKLTAPERALFERKQLLEAQGDFENRQGVVRDPFDKTVAGDLDRNKQRQQLLAAEGKQNAVITTGTPDDIKAAYVNWKTALEELGQVQGTQADIEPQVLSEREKYNTLLQLLNPAGNPPLAQRFATGGFVNGYGNSDSVNAMLTPGEFVMNKSAVQAIGASNLAAMQYFANGGNVSKGLAVASAGRTTSTGGGDLGAIVPALSGFTAPAGSLAAALNGFASTANTLVDGLSRIPTSITMEGRHEIVVVVNGLEALASLEPSLKNLVSQEINRELDRYTEEKFPDVGRRT